MLHRGVENQKQHFREVLLLLNPKRVNSLFERKMRAKNMRKSMDRRPERGADPRNVGERAGNPPTKNLQALMTAPGLANRFVFSLKAN